jgi:hypothetical protein
MPPRPNIYPIPYERAFEIIEELQLNPFSTHVEPSARLIYVFTCPSEATFFCLRFDAERWPSANEDVFLMCVLDQPEVRHWASTCESIEAEVELAQVWFGSSADRKRFEQVVWP